MLRSYLPRSHPLLLGLILLAVPVLSGCVGAGLSGDHGADGHVDDHTANAETGSTAPHVDPPGTAAHVDPPGMAPHVDATGNATDGHASHDNGTIAAPLLSKGDSWEYRFTAAGVYNYHCHPHPFMEAQIIVSDTDPAAKERVEVTMKDLAFSPTSVVVRVGGVVNWTNLDVVPHNVVLTPDGADPHAGHEMAAFESIDRSTAGLPASKPTEEVRLANGGVYNITASRVKHDPTGNSTPIAMFGYNGQIPGPTLRIPQGSNVTINFKNDLPFETTVHWHGLRLEQRFDGMPMVSQSPIKSGGSFKYTLYAPDAGVFWYHPHIREDIQQELGLAGVILVDAPRIAGEAWPREFVLALDDIKLENGDVAEMWAEEPNHVIMGRFGNQTLVNGKPTFTVEGAPGERIRLHMINIANARPFKVTMLNNSTTELIGADAGYYKAPKPYGHGPTFSPGERLTVDVVVPTNGSSIELNHAPHGAAPTYLGSIVPTGEPVATIPAPLSPHNRSLVEMGPAMAESNTSVDIEWILDFWMDPAHMVMMNMSAMYKYDENGTRIVHAIEYVDNMSEANAGATPAMARWIIRDNATGLENMDLDYTFEKGSFVRIKITNLNTTMHPMQHPIHIHGQRFLVDSTNGKLNADPVWKDVVTVPAGSEIILTVEISNPGRWMFHCHINEHLETGMHGMFNVV